MKDLIKHRPTLALYAPGEVRSGESFTVTLQVRAAREVPVEFIDVDFAGVDRCSVPSGKSSVVYRSVVVARSARVLGPSALPVGTHRYPVRIDLPDFAPPSYSGARASTEYTVGARVSIPWWPDRAERWALYVRRPPIAVTQARAVSYSSDPAGPRGSEPHIECSLADETVVPGGVLEGQIALFNVAHNAYRRMSLSLVCRERLYDDGGAERYLVDAQRYDVEVPISSPREGQAIPFRIAMPQAVGTSFRARLFQIEWALDVRVHVGMLDRVSMRVPITLVAPGSSRAETARRAPPTIGSERIHRVWDAVAMELGMRLEEGALRAELDDVRVSIARDHRGADGVFLVAKILHRGAGIGLDGGLASGFRRVLGGGVSFGDAAWDRDHYVTARESDQARAYGVVLFPLLRSHRVADWDDEHVVLEQRSAGTSQARLHAFAASVLAVARAIPHARDAIPPPRAMADDLPRWQSLSAIVEGTLELGPMIVRGRIDGMPCSVSTDWGTGTLPLATRLEVSPEQPLDAKHATRWTGAGGTPPPALSGPVARELVSQIVDGAHGLEISESGVAVIMPAPLPSPDRDAPARLRRMARLCTLLRPDAGPYR